MPIAHDINEAATADLSEKEFDQLRSLLCRVRANLTEADC